MNFEILTDSGCNLPEEKIEQLGLHIVSMAYVLGDEEKLSYVKGQKFDHKAFYDALKNKISAKTSQVSPEQAREVCRPIFEAGKDLLYVGFSSGLSGSFNAVRLVLDEFKEEFPDRKIFFTDTLAASAGQLHFVLEACKMRDEGKSIEETHAWLEDNKMKLCHYFTVDDLWHLQRGGRVSTGKAFMGTLLSVKPILIINNEGKLVPVGKAKGRKKSLDYLLERMEEKIDPLACNKVYIIHSDALADAEYLSEQVLAKYEGFETHYVYLEPVIGTHTGPGVCALIFMGKERE
ncbi:MAG: DegV family protein [Clostridiales bacterium]|jgi:DegV family protein with EDD domain|nr:DegV family protein [Clostridiales bacterium]